MPLRIPGVVGLQAMIANGLTAFIQTLYTQFNSPAQRRRALAARYPSGRADSLENAFQFVVQARRAANLVANFDRTPPLSQIPRDPVSAAAGRFRYDVVLRYYPPGVNPNDPTQRPTLAHRSVVYSDDNLNRGALVPLARAQAAREIGLRESESPTSRGYDPLNVQVDVISIVRR